MGTRYYNLKPESPDINGGLIKVDTSKRMDERLEDFSADFGTNPWTFRCLRTERENSIYEVSIPNEKVTSAPVRNPLGGVSNAVGPVPVGPPARAELILSPEGELSLLPSTGRFFLSEIPEDKAKKLREESYCWALQRAYVAE